MVIWLAVRESRVHAETSIFTDAVKLHHLLAWKVDLHAKIITIVHKTVSVGVGYVPFPDTV